MLINNKIKLASLIADLTQTLNKQKNIFFELNRKATLDVDYWIREDFEFIKSYLKHFVKNNYSPNLCNRIKPKGKILIILSYNEPLILSIIPVFNALITGNHVILKVNKRSEKLVRALWEKTEIINKYGLILEIVCPETHDDITFFIKKVEVVYFFGSLKVAQKIAKICGRNYVEFCPEVEAADIKIFDNKFSNIKKDAKLTLRESFSHSGQTCQRIQGVVVNKDIYEKYVKTIKNEFVKLCNSGQINNFVNKKFVINRRKLLGLAMEDISKSHPSEIIKTKELPVLVINPKNESLFIKNAYFLPILWVAPFDSEMDLIKILQSRKFFLGLNIQSDNKKLISRILMETKFTRYTINTTHINIRLQEGWGGAWPSSFNGYKSWIEHFSNNFTVINK